MKGQKTNQEDQPKDNTSIFSKGESGTPSTKFVHLRRLQKHQQALERRRQSSASPGVEDIQTWQEDNKFLQRESVVYIIQQSTPVGGGGDRFELTG